MKDWQDRGEVLDSDGDDEELSLDADSQTPRVRLLEPDPSSDYVWAGNKRRRLGSGHDVVVVNDEQPTGLSATSAAATLCSGDDVKVMSHVQVSSPRSSLPRYIVPDGPFESSPPARNHLELPRSSPPLASDDSPRTTPVHKPAAVEIEPESPLTPRNKALEDGMASSTLSSPLSEMQFSPSPPPGLLFHRVHAPDQSPRRSVRPDLFSRAIPLSYGTQSPTRNDVASDVLAAAYAARRGLRARNEKQLHPYMFDQAQYQRQCRERGMRPVRLQDSRRADQATLHSSSDDEDAPMDLADESDSAPHRVSSLGSDGLRTSPPAIPNRPDPVFNFDISSSENELESMGAVMGMEGARSRLSARTKRYKTHPDVAQHLVPTPPTSSGSAGDDGQRRPERVFKMPLGMSTTTIQTPQISSDANPGAPRQLDESSDDEPHVLGSRKVARVRPPILNDSSSESLSVQSTGNSPAHDKRLQRERRRAKGVLPASYFRIDLRAQQEPTTKPTNRAALSGVNTTASASPQKGVARVVSSRGSDARPPRQGFHISDEDSETDVSESMPAFSLLRQATLDLTRGAARSYEVVDDDLMEVDFVDPMLAGASFTRPKKHKSKSRQPRIDIALTGGVNRKDDFSEERLAMRLARPTVSYEHRSRATRRQQLTKKPPSASRLSILDAPVQDLQNGTNEPQFVRLAKRQARHQEDLGRHSPHRKQIRLATTVDTEDALAVLRDWRKGSIGSPLVPPSKSSGTFRKARSSAGVERNAPLRRLPLSDVTNLHHTRPEASMHLEKISSRSRAANTPRRRQMQASLHGHNREQSSHHEHSTDPNVESVAEKVSRVNSTKRVQRNQSVRHRAGQLETLENDFILEHRETAFARRINCLTEGIAPTTSSSVRHNLPLARYLEIEDAPSPLSALMSANGVAQNARAHGVPDGATRTLPHRARKRVPRRIDADARQYRQPSETIPDPPPSGELRPDDAAVGAHGLLGLGPVGTRYATTFDVSPLQLGTFFHGSSFIGSGDLAASLGLARRNLAISSGRIRIHIADEVCEWGPWTQDVSAGLARIPMAVCDAIDTLSGIVDSADLERQKSLVEANVDYLLRSTVRYFSSCISLIDSVDRRSCIQGILRLVEELLDSVSESQPSAEQGRKVRTRSLQYAFVLARQGYDLAKDSQIALALRQECKLLLLRNAKALVAHQPDLLADLRTFFEENRHASKREQGVEDSHSAVSTIIYVHHLLRDSDIPDHSFWMVMGAHLGAERADRNDVRILDNIWYSLFTVLPLLEIDERGVLRPGSRLQGESHHTELIKTLVETVLHSYAASSLADGTTINEYIRATLTRCVQLVTIWGWWRCETILGSIFDFFARRNLAHLQNEVCHGSPIFLGSLDKQPSLEVQLEDRCFHIFLKLLASALSGMRKYAVYNDKKIGSIAWRFMPNHGRTYRRDAEVRQEDIDALRNHHDLLCTLYYAAPPEQRLRVGLLQGLVNHSISHREACRLNVRAWSNLASFQISSGEPLERLNPFCDWFAEILTTTLSQYRLVRVEVEQDIAAARIQGAAAISSDLIETTVTRNQRQIVATLIDALAACRRCLRSASTLEAALHLIQGSQIWLTLDLYDPSLRRLNGMLEEAIAVIDAAIDVQNRFQTSVESQQISEDSQEFGDCSALLELADTQVPSPRLPNMLDLLHEPFGQLLSNVFGADSSADDVLLSKIIDAWVRLAGEGVQRREKTWMDYVNAYSSSAWTQLRDTEQKRRLTPYFLSRVVSASKGSVVGPEILSMWLTSLVDREASLKYQHLLTTTLLQFSGDEALLRNLPFSASPKSGQYEITLAELRQRRLALISSILSNMRENFDDTIRYRPQATRDIRRTLVSMLQQLMRAMRTKYMEVEASGTGAATGASKQGGYVDFVQQVVYFMQQYTASIQAIDEFFTDSAAFPLPATDPAYVVGKIRSYVPRLAESGTKKQLLSFLQSLCERAAVDQQQESLVDQLTVAAVGIAERGDTRAPSLRHLVCTTLFPAYVESSLATGASWILALPVLRAWAKIVEQLLYDALLDDIASAEATISIIETMLASILSPMRSTLCHPGLLSLPHVQRWLSTASEGLRACMTTVQHLSQVFPEGRRLAVRVERLMVLAARIESALIDPAGHDAIDTELEDELDDPAAPWPDALAYAREEVARTNDSALCAQDGRYLLRKNGVGREILVGLDESGGERDRLLMALGALRCSYGVVFERRSTGRAIGRSAEDEARSVFGEVFV